MLMNTRPSAKDIGAGCSTARRFKLFISRRVQHASTRRLCATTLRCRPAWCRRRVPSPDVSGVYAGGNGDHPSPGDTGSTTYARRATEHLRCMAAARSTSSGRCRWLGIRRAWFSFSAVAFGPGPSVRPGSAARCDSLRPSSVWHASFTPPRAPGGDASPGVVRGMCHMSASLPVLAVKGESLHPAVTRRPAW
jgi:hypothetical protein